MQPTAASVLPLGWSLSYDHARDDWIAWQSRPAGILCSSETRGSTQRGFAAINARVCRNVFKVRDTAIGGLLRSGSQVSEPVAELQLAADAQQCGEPAIAQETAE